MSATDTTKEFVARHPRLLGFIFAVMVALSQAGSATAGGTAQIGP